MSRADWIMKKQSLSTEIKYRFNWKESILAFCILNSAFCILPGCKEDEVIKPSSGALNYVSNDVGRWIIYDCDSITHLDNDNNTDNNVDTAYFQIKEVIDSIGVDAEGEAIQHLSRYIKEPDSTGWIFRSRWTAKINSYGYQRVEENIRYLKLGFPISLSTKWNGNAYNNLGEEDYFYADLHAPETFNDFSFDSTITVVQGDSTIGYHTYPFGIEKYAASYGMYYRYRATIDFFPGTTIIISGVQYHERMNSFGHL
jgi:hypothetical protein